jgi:hypothetical protein
MFAVYFAGNAIIDPMTTLIVFMSAIGLFGSVSWVATNPTVKRLAKTTTGAAVLAGLGATFIFINCILCCALWC